MENYLDLLIPLHGKKEALEDALNALEKVTSSKLHPFFNQLREIIRLVDRNNLEGLTVTLGSVLAEIKKVGDSIDVKFNEVKAEVQAVENRLGKNIADVENRLGQRLDKVETNIQKVKDDTSIVRAVVGGIKSIIPKGKNKE